MHVEGVDFFETFSPVVKLTTIRVVLTLTLSKGLILRHLDINNAFLNENLIDDVFMAQALSFEHGRFLVCKQKKCPL